MRLVAPSGDVALDRGAWGGITASNPFAPLPSEFTGKYLALRTSFYYNPDPGDIKENANPASCGSGGNSARDVGLSISPSGPVQVAAESTQQFSANLSGGGIAAVTWLIVGDQCTKSDCGTVTATGLYVAPTKVPEPPEITLTATQAFAAFRSVSAQVTIVAPNQAPAKPSAQLPSTSSAPDRLAEATALYRKGRFDEAEQRYQQILQEDPKSGEAYAGLARLYLGRKKVQQANDTISKGLEVADSVPVRVALGEVYFRQGKIPEAEHEWLSVVNSGRADSRAHLGLARVSTATTRYKQAKTEIDKAHTLDPGDPDIQAFWIRSLRPSEQVAYLEDYLSHESSDTAEERTHLRNYLEYLKARLKDSAHSCRLAVKLASTEADLFRLSGERPNQMRGYGLAVALNGQNAKLQIDTGASGIVIDRKIAQKAGLIKLSDTTLGGFGDGGESSGYFAMATTVKVGELEFRDCPVVVVDKRSVLGEDGLIGADVFQEFLIDLDFPNEKLRLGQLPKRPDENLGQISLQTVAGDSDSLGRESTDAVTPADKANEPAYVSLPQRFLPPEFSFSFTPVFRFGHVLLIPTEVGDIPERLFAIDTGAPRNIFSVNAARQITKVRGNPRMTVKGLSGSVNKVYAAEKTALQFGHVQQYAENQITLDLESMSDKIGTEVSGVLGAFNFRFLDITIDYRDGLVAFEYKPKL